jgi:hypothetical protein
MGPGLLRDDSPKSVVLLGRHAESYGWRRFPQAWRKLGFYY